MRYVYRHLKSHRTRTSFLFLWLLLAAGFFLWVVNHHYPIRHWLFFVYAQAWGWTLFFCCACLSAGWQIIRWLLPGTSRLHERLMLAFAIGVVTFYLGLFVFGIARMYGTAFFLGWPLAMLLFGANRSISDFLRYRRQLARFGARLILPRNWIEYAGAALMMLSVVALYLPALIPENIAYDSCWYHLPIAEHYAAYGGIRKFDEGWYLGAYPHLASNLYTWALLSPGSFYQRLMLCSHLEFALFTAGLFATSVLAEKLIERRYKLRLPYAAAATFLFPGIFVHDANLATNADHIMGFWVAPIAVSLFRFAKTLSAREAWVSGMLVGAALCTKLQGVYFFVPSALLVGWVALRRLTIKPALVWSIACVLVASTTWVKNLVYYGDPYYPLFRGILPVSPTFDGAGALIQKVFWDPYFLPKGNGLVEKLAYAVKTSFTFSLVPNGVDEFPGKAWPGFGSLYTLLAIPVLLLLRAPRALWVAAGCIQMVFFIWYLTSHQERYLQTLLPVFAAITATALILAWRASSAVRVGVVVLVAAQLVWQSDAYFRPFHAMAGDAPIRVVAAHLGAAYNKKYEERFKYGSTFRKVHQHLPPDARALLHYFHLKLGLGVQTVTDGPGWQGAIEYLIDDSPDAALKVWQKVGVTHVVWLPRRDQMDPQNIARDLVFMRTLSQYSNRMASIDGWLVHSLNSEPRDATGAAQKTKIAWLACSFDVPAGIYTADGLARAVPVESLDLERAEAEELHLPVDVNAVALQSSCSGVRRYFADARAHFVSMGHAASVELLVRN